MEIPVKLEAYEGPLDLLLQLIEKNKVSIYDIPIAEITDQYIATISRFSPEDLEGMSEFLVMAATLLDIKSRMLLPPEVNDEGEEIDPREELVQKLLEYKMYRYMGNELRDRQDDASRVFYRPQSLPEEVKSYRAPVDSDALLKDVDLAGLYKLYNDLIRRQNDRVDIVHGGFASIKKDPVDLSAAVRRVSQYIYEKKECMFHEILEQHRGKQYKIVSFLTLLELMKQGRVEVSQPESFADIHLKWTGSGDFDASEEMSIEYD